MTGKYNVIVENAYIKYDFYIQRNITVIKGHSATGKTTLYEMVRQYTEEEDTGINIQCKCGVGIVYGRNWEAQIASYSHSILFIDEQSRFVKSIAFAETIRGTDNYYVIITREKLSALPYSIDEIYGIRTSGKYAGLVGEYTRNEFYRIYGENPIQYFKPDVIITEDSNSGYEFWKYFFRDQDCQEIGGKSNIIKKLRKISRSDANYLAIVDGAAFGSEMEEFMQYITYQNPNMELYAPESFEYMILTCGIFQEKDIKDKCANTYEFADSKKYMSWEQFYTALLSDVTSGTVRKYSKRKLNAYYLSDTINKLVARSMPEQLLSDRKR